MGNYIALCMVGELHSKAPLMKEARQKVLQIMKFDGKILEFKTTLLVKDLLVNYPNSYVGLFKEATQPLPLDYMLKIGKIYYLLPTSVDDTNHNSNNKSTESSSQSSKVVEGRAKRIKVVITKEQLQQLLAKQGHFEELIIKGVTPPNSVCSSDEFGSSSSSNWLPKLEPVPEGNKIVY